MQIVTCNYLKENTLSLQKVTAVPMSPLFSTTSLSTPLCKPLRLSMSKRFMWRTVLKKTVYLTSPPRPNVIERTKHTTCYKFKSKSAAANDLISDDSGKHPHVVKEICIENSCEEKKCPQLCNSLDCWKTKGHFTHDPVTGKFSVFIGNIDANGKPGSQYFTENHDTNKKAEASKVATYVANKEAIPHPKGNAYIKDPNVANKIDP